MQWLEPTVKRTRPFSPVAKPRRPTPVVGFTLEEEQKWSQLREVKRPSVKPVPMPSFKAVSFSEELQELLESLRATEESQRQVEAIACELRESLHLEVRLFALAQPQQGTAFGVAVPEVEAVVESQTKELKMQKAMIRSCTEKLVAQGAFKFRRSTFRGLEPKVTLIAPNGLAFNLSVNGKTPWRCQQLFQAAKALNPLAEELILVVRRWAKDRGISHAAKGHLSPYGWLLLVVYYLQAMRQLPGMRPAPAVAAFKPPKSSTGVLLRGFMKFYDSFNWSTECISVRSGHRLPLAAEGPGPCIEDPFETSSNVASGMHWLSTTRLREELSRGTRQSSLAELLEPWSPPDMD